MKRRIVFVVGTGTGVGKTTFTAAWIRSLRADGIDAVGWKPVETGGAEDQAGLGIASGRSIDARYAFPTPISPHRAASLAGGAIDLQVLADECRALSQTCEALIVESAGGLFSPLDPNLRTNAELLAAVPEASVVLVAPNRLGVLHDVEACLRGLATTRLGSTGSLTNIDAIVLNRRLDVLDASVATNLLDLQTERGPSMPPVIAFDGRLDDEATRALREVMSARGDRPA